MTNSETNWIFAWLERIGFTLKRRAKKKHFFLFFAVCCCCCFYIHYIICETHFWLALMLKCRNITQTGSHSHFKHNTQSMQNWKKKHEINCTIQFSYNVYFVFGFDKKIKSDNDITKNTNKTATADFMHMLFRCCCFFSHLGWCKEWHVLREWEHWINVQSHASTAENHKHWRMSNFYCFGN